MYLLLHKVSAHPNFNFLEGHVTFKFEIEPLVNVTWSRGISRMWGILILSYRLKEVTNSYVLHCFWTSKNFHIPATRCPIEMGFESKCTSNRQMIYNEPECQWCRSSCYNSNNHIIRHLLYLHLESNTHAPDITRCYSLQLLAVPIWRFEEDSIYPKYAHKYMYT